MRSKRLSGFINPARRIQSPPRVIDIAVIFDAPRFSPTLPSTLRCAVGVGGLRVATRLDTVGLAFCVSHARGRQQSRRPFNVQERNHGGAFRRREDGWRCANRRGRNRRTTSSNPGSPARTRYANHLIRRGFSPRTMDRRSTSWTTSVDHFNRPTILPPRPSHYRLAPFATHSPLWAFPMAAPSIRGDDHHRLDVPATNSDESVSTPRCAPTHRSSKQHRP